MRVFVLTMAILAGVVSPIASANAGICTGWCNPAGCVYNCN